MCRYSVDSSTYQFVSKFDDSSRNRSTTNKHLNCRLLQAVRAACLSVVVIGIITAAGFSNERSFAQTANSSSASASGATKAAQHGSRLTVSAQSLSFGNVMVNTATTLPLTLTSSGTSALNISSVSITGAGFSIVAQSFPVALNPNQSLTLLVQFDPTTTGNASGQLTINSDSSGGKIKPVSLGGTATAGNPQLTISTTNLTFSSVPVNTATMQPLTLTSSGISPLTVSSASIAGAGFSIVGGSFPVTLNPTQILTIQVQFDPTVTGNATGQLTINSNSSSGSAAVVTLSGAGASGAHQVDLSWNAPTSSTDPVAGYNVYRSPTSGSFLLLNASPLTALSYVDSTVVSGASYTYEVKSVDSNGVESIPSNQVTETVP